MRRRLTPVAVALASVLLAACGGAAAPAARSASSPSAASTGTGAAAPLASRDQPCGVAPPGSAPIDRVVWIWMENHTAGAVLDGDDAPYERSLAAACGASSSYAAVGSPSLPNYLAATSGAVHGVHDDAGPTSHPIDADNLFRQVRSAGGTARSYQESMAEPCQLASAGRYAVKHNPAAYYVGADDREACQRDDVPLPADAADLELGAFTFVTPDLCHDTHDCPVRDGDEWLAGFLPPLLDSDAYRAGHVAIFVVWDEPTPMPLLVLAPSVPSGTRSDEPIDHYSLLRTTEELLGLPLLGEAEAATSLRAAFRI